jgi:DNA-binding transcriptional ArsR family regulator
MESEQAILSFAALAQPTRLEVFRLLVRAEPKGISAGELAKSLAVPANTLSSHLNVMTRAGLVRGERHSRTIIYRARVDELRALIGFLLKDCCDGRPDICTPILDDISCCTKATCP